MRTLAKDIYGKSHIRGFDILASYGLASDEGFCNGVRFSPHGVRAFAYVLGKNDALVSCCHQLGFIATHQDWSAAKETQTFILI